MRPRAAGPILILEPADAPEHGGIADSTELLRALADSSTLRPAAFAFIVDQEAVEQAYLAGTGAQLDRRLGARLSRDHGAPLEARFQVEALPGGTPDHGRCALLQCNGLSIAVTERIAPLSAPDALMRLGIHASRFPVIGAKTASGTLNMPDGPRVVCDSAGPAAFDLRSLPFTTLRPRN